MSYADLRKECDRDGIGPLFWGLLVDVCGRVARRYPPSVYNNNEQWSDEALTDLALSVASERLLDPKENQLDYVLSLASDEDSLAGLLAFQVRRVLTHRRSVTVVDRLVGRMRTLATESSRYEQVRTGTDTWVSFVDEQRAPAALSERALRAAANSIEQIPRLPSSLRASRESKVYAKAELEEALETLVDGHSGIFFGDIRKILEILLTAWLPTVLEDSEEEQISGSGPEFELERSQMATLIDEIANEFSDVQRRVLLGKSQDLSDGELARRLSRSRPWIADRKAEVLQTVETRLINELPPELHSVATRELLEALAMLEGADE